MSDNKTFTFTEEEMTILAAALAPAVFAGEYYSSEFKDVRKLIEKLSKSETFEDKFEYVVNTLAESGFKDVMESLQGEAK